VSRLPPLDAKELSPDQRAVYDKIAAAHGGHVRGPWAVALRVPEVARHSHALYERLCVQTKLGKRRFELMVIVVARHWTSQFEWWAHARLARENGLPETIVQAIQERQIPYFDDEDDRLIYEVTRELCESRTLSQGSYDRALGALGEELLVELIAGISVYTMIAMQLNAFDVEIPAGAVPLA
jgi:4-carboxymuconolactone decarboxylase